MTTKNTIHQIRVELKGAKPPIWRKLLVWSDCTLGQLHEIIQIAMGWTDSHLHEFRLRDRSHRPGAQEITQRINEGNLDRLFLDLMDGCRTFVSKTPLEDDPFMEEMDGEDEEAVTLGEVCPKVKSKMTYTYDFGDDWDHTITVQKIVDPQPGVEVPVCLGGKKACPPEDCGGLWGYYRLLDGLADPKADGHDEAVEWIGPELDPDAFDLEEINAGLAIWREAEEGTMDADDKRIQEILGDDNERTMRNAKRYRDYLIEHLSLPVTVTGREDFPWEEPYVVGGWDVQKYEELKKTNPSYTDTFEITSLTPPNMHADVVAQVRRLSDGRYFEIGLSWLTCDDEDDDAHTLLEDYGVWHANY
ncbi:MAG: plasmid pRiA4b ORF-3 family protein [Planctomycetota bacterium]